MLEQRSLGIQDDAVARLDESRLLKSPTSEGDQLAANYLGKLYNSQKDLHSYLFGLKHGIPIHNLGVYSRAVAAGFSLVADSEVAISPLKPHDMDDLHAEMMKRFTVEIGNDGKKRVVLTASPIDEELKRETDIGYIWHEDVTNLMEDPQDQADFFVGFSGGILAFMKRMDILTAIDGDVEAEEQNTDGVEEVKGKRDLLKITVDNIDELNHDIVSFMEYSDISDEVDSEDEELVLNEGTKMQSAIQDFCDSIFDEHAARGNEKFIKLVRQYGNRFLGDEAEFFFYGVACVIRLLQDSDAAEPLSPYYAKETFRKVRSMVDINETEDNDLEVNINIRDYDDKLDDSMIAWRNTQNKRFEDDEESYIEFNMGFLVGSAGLVMRAEDRRNGIYR